MEKFETSSIKTEVSEEAVSPSEFITSFHRSLRTRSIGKDFQEVKDLWLEHTRNKEILRQYSETMHKLATEHWEKKIIQETTISRINWAYNSIKEYFFGDLLLRKIEKEERRISVLEQNNKEKLLEKTRKAKENIGSIKKLKVLDVGSCYNPFGKFEDLDVTAIDLHPANTDVYCCDFLNTEVIKGPDDEIPSVSKSSESSENLSKNDYFSQAQRCKRIKLELEDEDIMGEICHSPNSIFNKSQVDLDKFSGKISHKNDCSKSSYENKTSDSSMEEVINNTFKEESNSTEQFLHIKQLKESSFDIVIFSYLLEYIPSPKLRYECCVKAYKLLKSNGILCIITPDAKHLTRNVLFFKLWKSTLALIGFERVKYEKCSKFHAMIFRKVIAPATLKDQANQELSAMKSSKFFSKFPQLKWETVYDSIYIIQDYQIMMDDEK